MDIICLNDVKYSLHRNPFVDENIMYKVNVIDKVTHRLNTELRTKKEDYNKMFYYIADEIDKNKEFIKIEDTIPVKVDDKLWNVKVTEYNDNFISEKLESITLGNNIDIVGEDNFINCPNLKHIILPKSLNVIGENAFLLNNKLETITIQNINMKKVHKGSFNSNSLKYFILKGNKKEIHINVDTNECSEKYYELLEIESDVYDINNLINDIIRYCISTNLNSNLIYNLSDVVKIEKFI